jgi:hypothetical protein
VKSREQRNRESIEKIDRERATHHVTVGRAHDARHGDPDIAGTKISDARTLTQAQYDRLAREAPKSIKESHTSGRGKNMRHEVVFKSPRHIPSWLV